jgi:TPR repeat protein/peptidoglycan hydrolase-like protein with peptidoglycan-binding domain
LAQLSKIVLIGSVIILGANDVLGANLQKGLEAFGMKDFATANSELRPLADKGNAEAQYTLGMIFFHGYGVTKDIPRAFDLFSRAAKQGDKKHQFALGWMYAKVEEVANIHEAIKWYRKAASRGHAYSQINLGNIYFSGKKIAKDYAKAIKWYRLAAENGLALAQFEMGAQLSNGGAVPADPRLAYFWNSLALKGGLEKARKWKIKNAQSLTTEEVLEIDRKVIEFKPRNVLADGDVIKDHTGADTAPTVTAEKSPTLSSGDFQKGFTAFAKGDHATALRELTPLAEQGSARAQYGLGVMYANGRGVTQDYKTAIKWYKLSAEQGHAGAQKRLQELQKQIADQKTAPAVTAKKYPTPPPQPKVDQQKRLELARRTQEALQVLGLYSGKLDGIIGVRTRSAIRGWQRRNGYSATGEITEIQLVNLEDQAVTRLAEKKSPAPPTKPTIAPAQTKDTTPPSIEIASAIQVKEDSPTIRGKVSDNEKVVQVTVAGRAIDITSSGRFSFKRYVPLDGTQVTIEAIDEWGNKSTKVVKLTREAVQTAAINRFDALDPTNFSAKKNSNAVALIIGIADYKRTAKAKYADRDAEYFSDYARRKLGVPQSNIKVLTNSEAGQVDILELVSDWLPGTTRAEKSDVYVFFAGHGLSSEDGKEVYLLPHNSSPKLLNDTALRRSKLFDKIASTQPRSVTVFLDTCYSGSSRNEEVLLAQRGIAVEPIKQSIPSNFTVFSAAGMKQTAKMLDDAKHGLFSYYLMKGMEGDADTNKDKKITSGELHKYVLANVSRMQRNQTPELQGDQSRVLVQW